MCARFTLRTPAAILAKMFEIAWDDGFQARSNISPTTPIYVIRCADQRREVASVQWDFVPFWSKTPKFRSQPTFNATAEKVATNGMFRQSFRRRRCLIPCDGWYEWQDVGKKLKERYFFRLPQQPCFAFAGIWDRWVSEDETTTIESGAIITTEANELVAKIHTKRRMPVILRPEEYGLWLDHEIADPTSLLPLLRPFPDDEMEVIRVPNQIDNGWFDARCWPQLAN